MTDPTPRRKWLSVAVGVFALWQLIYLPAANLIDLVPRRPAPNDIHPDMRLYQSRGAFTSNEGLQRAAERVGDVLDFWGEVTGQEQGWRLFAPGFPPHTIFPALELRYPDGTAETLRSRFEPTDLTRPPSRAPLIRNRPFAIESQLVVAGWMCTDESLAERPELWRRLWIDAARDNRRTILAWMAWRARGHGEPREAVLKFRYIPTPLPNEPRGWTKPGSERPFARWTPATGLFEGYDPVSKQFVPLGESP